VVKPGYSHAIQEDAAELDVAVPVDAAVAPTADALTELGAPDVDADDAVAESDAVALEAAVEVALLPLPDAALVDPVGALAPALAVALPLIKPELSAELAADDTSEIALVTEFEIADEALAPLSEEPPAGVPPAAPQATRLTTQSIPPPTAKTRRRAVVHDRLGIVIAIQPPFRC